MSDCADAPCFDHPHEWGPERTYRHHTGVMVSVKSCPCGVGSVVTPAAPSMTFHWLLEHLEGVEAPSLTEQRINR